MRTQLATVLLALAAPLHAIKITSPSKNDVVDLAQGVKVEWSTVSTDPATAHLVLTNMAAGHTPFRKDFGEVDLSTGSATVSHDDVPSDAGFQFNFESVDEMNTGILAQSEQFEVEASAKEDDEEKTTKSEAAATSATSVSVSASVKTAMLTSTFTSGDVTITSTATTLSTVSSSATATDGGDGDDEEENATETGSATVSPSTAAAVPTGVAMQAGGLFALAAGVAAVMA